MRTFVAACLVAIVIAIVGAAVLNSVVQESPSTAFSTTAVRL